jgi:hypothetical protein
MLFARYDEASRSHKLGGQPLRVCNLVPNESDKAVAVTRLVDGALEACDFSVEWVTGEAFRDEALLEQRPCC